MLLRQHPWYDCPAKIDFNSKNPSSVEQAEEIKNMLEGFQVDMIDSSEGMYGPIDFAYLHVGIHSFSLHGIKNGERQEMWDAIRQYGTLESKI